RRAICGGLVLGAAAALLLALLEVGYVAWAARTLWVRPLDLAKFGLYALGLLLLCGSLAGIVFGMLAAAIMAGAEWLGRRQSGARKWTVRLYTAALTPGIA